MTMQPSRSYKPARILILGIGDLGAHIARMIVENGYASTCLLAGQSGAAAQWAKLLALATGKDIRAAQVDGEDVEALQRLLADFEPDAIIQCATLLSPFAIGKMSSPAARAIQQGGFALQIAAQLPVLRALMTARRALGMTCPVINCSYPDVTHPMLAAEGLSPEIGIGNVAILALRFERLLQMRPGADLRVVGHHAQLGPSLRGESAGPQTPVPLVYLDGELLGQDKLLLRPGLATNATMNYLSAVTTLPMLQGLLDQTTEANAHVPGIEGLHGGYPIRFIGGRPVLRLPDAITLEEAKAFNLRAAAGDGVERIDADGTLHYTQAARDAVAPWCPRLAEPLGLPGLAERLKLLRQVLTG